MLRKRIMIAVMALAMLILVMSNAVFAESQLTVTAGKTKINKGTTTASVTLSVSNNPGAAILAFQIGYNAEVMTLESVSLSEEVFSSSAVIAGELSRNPYAYLARDLSAKATDGLLATLNFTVNADCPAGEYPIILTADEQSGAIDINGIDIPVTLVNGSITVNDPFAGMAAKVVKDGTETGYATLPEALSAAADGDTVKLLSDVTISGEIGVNGKAITVDGGNYTIYLAADPGNGQYTCLFAAGTGGGITFKNVTITSAAGVASHTYAAARVYGGGNIILDTGAVIKDYVGGNGGALFCDGSESTIVMKNGSEIRNCKDRWRAPVGIDKGTFTMEGGTITGCTANTDNNTSAIFCNSNATVNLNGGVITGNTGGNCAVGVKGKVNVTSGANVTNNGGVNIKKMAVTAKINVDGGKMTGNLSAAGTLWVDDKYVAVAGTSLYNEVWKAVYSVKDGRTVYLLKDAEFKTPSAAEVTAEETATGVDISTSTALDRSQNLVFDGQGHTLYMKGAKTSDATLTFKNVTMDITGSTSADNGAFRWFGGTLTFGNGCDVYGKEYTEEGNPGGYLLYLGGGTANIEEGCVIHDNKRYAKSGVYGGAIRMEGGTLNMKGGKITGCRAHEGGAIFVNKGTFNMTGGEISGNYSWSGSGIRAYYEGPVLNISGNAKVYDNFEGTSSAATKPDNIRANTDTALNIDKAFTGKLGFKFDKPGSNVLGAKIGTIANGLTLASVDSVVCDTDPTLFAYVSNGELKLTKKLTLTPDKDQGKYTKTGDTATYGVVRVNTTVTEVPLADSVEEMGTYFYKTTNNGPLDLVTSGPNYFKLKDADMTDLASEKGYTADLVDITGETATVCAVNFYKLKGIDGYVFEALAPVEYAQATAKNLGNNPGQLNNK